jgi:hypothetical protein
MRKLFNIDQEEKNRILEMHENATKRHYLNETGVAFASGEPNGFKMNKMETMEQTAATTAPKINLTDPNIVRKLYNKGNELFNRGQKEGYFMIPDYPTTFFAYNLSNEENFGFGNNPLFVHKAMPSIGYAEFNRKNYNPIVLPIVSSLRIIPDSGTQVPSKIGGKIPVAPLKVEKEQYPVNEYRGDDTLWQSYIPQEILRTVITNAYNQLPEPKKVLQQEFVQKPGIPTQYKQLIQSLA